MALHTGWLLQLLQNVCLFAAILFCYREIIRGTRGERQRTLLLAALFGAGALTGTMLPVALPTGHAFDAEVLPIGLSALFGGPIVALVTTLIADAAQMALYRGDVLDHVVEPTIGGLLGYGFLMLERRQRAPFGLGGFIALGSLLGAMPVIEALLLEGIALATLTASALLYVIPSGILATAALGTLLRREDRNLTRERAHAQESKMLDAVLESMSDGLLAIDADGRFLVFNRPAQEMLGDWRGDKFVSWLTDYKRFRLDGVTPITEDELALPRALRGLETNDLTVLVRSPRHPEGLVVSVNGRPLRDDRGNVVAGITVVRDVTELLSAQKRLAQSEALLKQSEERYALAFEGSYDGLWDRDLRTGKAFFSARCFEIIGLEKKNYAAGRMVDYDWWANRIHPEDSIRVFEAVNAALRNGARSFEIEYRIRRTNGTYCWISDRGAISRDTIRSPYRLAGSFTDISARKLAEEHRRMLEEQLQQTQKIEALGTLAGGIAHDINNTLIPIIGTVDLLLEDADKDGDLAESLQDVMTAALKIKDLVRQILSFSRNEGSERCTVSMDKEIAETLRMLRAMVPATISLDLQARAEGLICQVNQTQIHQVLMNLISNAVAAISPNRGAISVTLDRMQLEDPATVTGQDVAPGPFCRISVTDTGPGIPAEAKSRLFDPFFTTKPVGEGTGLGLSVVQGIVRDHGGFVLVDNEPGAGARFDVHFPLVQQRPATEPMAQAS